MNCPNCKSSKMVKAGIAHRKKGDIQRYQCRRCRKVTTVPTVPVEVSKT
jgi:transposase-like protein